MKYLLFLLAAPLAAQSFYLLPDSFFVSPGERVRVGIHSGDSFPISEQALPRETVKDPSMYTSSGAYNMTGLRVDGAALAVDVSIKGPGTPMLAVRTEPDGTGDARVTRFAKSLLYSGKSDDAFKRRANHALEFVPEQNPYTTKAGATLPVHVLLNAKPAADIQVEAAVVAGEGTVVTVVGRTDAGGHILVPLTAPGKWRLAAAAQDGGQSYAASLTFEIK